MSFTERLDPRLLVCRLQTDSRDQLLAELARRFALVEPSVAEAQVLDTLKARECLGSTATPEGVAFPHAIRSDISRQVIGVVTLSTPVEFPCTEGPVGVRLVFVMFGSTQHPMEHIQTLARLARLAADPDRRERLMQAADEAQLIAELEDESQQHG